MDGYKNIIEKIRQDSQDEIAKEKQLSSEKIDEIEKDTAKTIENISLKTQTIISQLEEEIVSRRKTVAEIDTKKILLSAKQEILDDVFSTAKNALHNLPDTEYLKLIESMITKNATDGDTVAVFSADQKVVTKKFVADLSRKLGLNLGYEVIDGDDGGVILKNKNCDKNMSLSLEISEIKDEIESEIGKRLF